MLIIKDEIYSNVKWYNPKKLYFKFEEVINLSKQDFK